MRQVPRLAGGDVSKELNQSSHGDVVGENLVGVDQLSQPWSKPCMSTDDSSHQAFNGQGGSAPWFSRPLGPPDTSGSSFLACRFSGIAL